LSFPRHDVRKEPPEPTQEQIEQLQLKNDLVLALSAIEEAIEYFLGLLLFRLGSAQTIGEAHLRYLNFEQKVQLLKKLFEEFEREDSNSAEVIRRIKNLQRFRNLTAHGAVVTPLNNNRFEIRKGDKVYETRPMSELEEVLGNPLFDIIDDMKWAFSIHLSRVHKEIQKRDALQQALDNR